MADDDNRKRVLDPEQDAAALKALTHPLRIQLLGLLRQDGPATATELAVKAGESSASTSYHLRVLAKYGFVAEAEHRDGRERRWRSVHEITSWNNEAMHASPDARHFVSEMSRRQVEHLRRSLARHESDLAEGRLGPEWVEPSGIADAMPRLTAGSLDELKAAFEAKLDELTRRDAEDPDAEQVIVVVAGLPVAPRETETGQAGPGRTEPDGAGPDETGPGQADTDPDAQ
ncbi:ArsR/SmtB family transcription factor [Streptomyces sp. NBC_00483]|uniref:ArsR/SmtB family transcription factor n=1 Tax=Streptomyces sp. NBC_00483 TaxID=2975756 RepID=UPI002E17B84F